MKVVEWELILSKILCTNNTTYMNFLALTRTHSSRMHTIRCSGWRVSASGVTVQRDVCLEGVYLGEGCLPMGMSAREGVCLSSCWDTHPPVNRILDTCLWKHYLSATTLRTVNMKIPKEWPQRSKWFGKGTLSLFVFTAAMHFSEVMISMMILTSKKSFLDTDCPQPPQMT